MLKRVLKVIYDNNIRNNRHGLKLRSLSLCVKIEIESGHRRNGFRLSSEGEGHGWNTGHGDSCCCPLCAVARSIADAAEWFPEIQNLALGVYFKCKQGRSVWTVF